MVKVTYNKVCLTPTSLSFFVEDVLIQHNDCLWSVSMEPPWIWGIWREWLFIFRELGSTGNYFQGFEEQAHSFGDLGSPAKK